MSKKRDYSDKFKTFKNKTLYEKLDDFHREFIRDISYHYKFTFQEFRQVVEATRDLSMWVKRT